jgi:hypothetical protein
MFQDKRFRKSVSGKAFQEKRFRKAFQGELVHRTHVMVLVLKRFS